MLTAHGEPLDVGARAFDTLLVLVQRAPGVVTKAELLESVWRGLVVEENNLEVQVSTLRKLLGRESVVTVHGHGYRFGPQPIEAGDDRAASRTNVPLLRSALYGRVTDSERVNVLLRTHRLVTLIGPGGIGKTQLALSVARDLLPGYPDGAWVVELAALADGRLVTRAAASVLGVVEGDDSVSLEAIALSLQAKSLLLVIDNCEHLLPAAATLVEALLGKCAGLHVLATSREPLRLEGEAVYDLEPAGDAAPGFGRGVVGERILRRSTLRRPRDGRTVDVRAGPDERPRRSKRLHATRGPSPCHRARCRMPSLDDGERDREAAHA